MGYSPLSQHVLVVLAEEAGNNSPPPPPVRNSFVSHSGCLSRLQGLLSSSFQRVIRVGSHHGATRSSSSPPARQKKMRMTRQRKRVDADTAGTAAFRGARLVDAVDSGRENGEKSTFYDCGDGDGGGLWWRSGGRRERPGSGCYCCDCFCGPCLSFVNMRARSRKHMAYRTVRFLHAA
ncbi:hypothetical protein ACOMHN_004049 [Nucella lapillus]